MRRWCIAWAICWLLPAASAQEPDDRLVAVIEQSRALAGSGATDEAVALLQTIAGEWAQAGQTATAAQALRAALSLAPDDPVIHARLGHLLLIGQQYAAAREFLEKAADLGAAGAQFYYDLGSARWETGDPAAAAQALRMAVEQAGGSPVPVHQLGRLELWRGHYAQAVELLSQAAASMPGSVDVLYDLARALDRAGHSEQAVTVYRQLLAKAPGHIQGRYGLAQALLRTGQREAASREIATYHRLYRQDQQEIQRQGRLEAKLSQAQRLLDQGRPEQSLRLLDNAPETPQVLLVRSLALRALGRDPEAAVLLEKAVSMEPQRSDLRVLLTELRASEDEAP